MAKIKVQVDQLKCIGAGQCVFASPDVFDQRQEDGIVILLMDEPPDERISSVKKAVEQCPARAISLREL